MPLIEVLPTGLPSRAAQPGWAYVPDTGPIAAIQPGQRKRGRDDKVVGSSAKQQKAIEQRLKDLDKENYKDIPIPIPKSDRDRSKGKKMTSNVRRILGYNRNFGHYLADEEALIAAGGGGASAVAQSGPMSTSAAAAQKDGKGRGGDSAAAASRRAASGQNTSGGAMAPPPTTNKSTTSMKTEDHDVGMTSSSSPITSPKHSCSESHTQHPAPSASGVNPLLRTLNLPPRPSDHVMALLVAEPPLSYSAACAKPLDPHAQLPARHFCGVCGYWGKVKCRKCGEWSCGLMECWKSHEVGGCGLGVY